MAKNKRRAEMQEVKVKEECKDRKKDNKTRREKCN